MHRSRCRLNAGNSSKSAAKDDKREREKKKNVCELSPSAYVLRMITQERGYADVRERVADAGTEQSLSQEQPASPWSISHPFIPIILCRQAEKGLGLVASKSKRQKAIKVV